MTPFLPSPRTTAAVLFLSLLGLVPVAQAQKTTPPAGQSASSVVTVTGSVQSLEGEPLPGATVFVRGTFVGTSTGPDGSFRLSLPSSNTSATLELQVSYIGYESQKVAFVANTGTVTIKLQPSATMLSETVVAASRVEQTLAEAPVTIEKMNTTQITRLAAPDVMVGLGNMKGIDVSSSAMLMSSVSTRGFNSAKSERVIQLADYIDTQSPSLNVNAGNLLGIPEVDMESVDVLHGPSSALYGANAFNGVILFNSKDPFVYEGLTARLRGGTRAYTDAQVRYAKKITPRLAAKLNLSYQQADDFMPVNFQAQEQLLEPGNNSESSIFGYNAVNRYGDTEQGSARLTSPNGQFFTQRIYMPGFTERELVADDNRTYGVRVQPTLSYLITDKLKATAGYRFSRGTTTYQSSSRYRFKDLSTQQFFAEIKSDKFFVRAYTTEDDGGKTYDMNFLGAFLQDQSSDVLGRVGGVDRALTYREVFTQTFNTAFGAEIQRIRAANPALPLSEIQQQAAPVAYAAAAATQLKPGSTRFNELRNKIITDATPGKGALIQPNSRMSDVSAQYQFKLPSDIGLIVGGAFRDFRLGSGGRLFSDTTGSRLRNHEYGAYAQATKGFMENRLKLAFAGRMDFFRNFDPAFSPRASVTYAIGKNLEHNFRVSYSRAFRSPAQLDQYINLDLVRAYLLGNVAGGFQGYDLLKYRANPVVDSATLASYQISIPALRLEEVNTFEAGYRASLTEKLSLDLNVYFSKYNHFIGARRFIGNVDGSRPTLSQLQGGTVNSFATVGAPTRVIQAWTNADQPLDTRGAALGLSYAFSTMLNLSGSYSYNELTTTDLPADFQTFFNTPKHKFTLGVNGMIANDFTYGLNYRWADAYRYEMPFAAGTLAAPSSLDMTLGYHVEKLKTTFQAGGTNLLDANNIQVYGAPSMGRILFAGLLLEIK